MSGRLNVSKMTRSIVAEKPQGEQHFCLSSWEQKSLSSLRRIQFEAGWEARCWGLVMGLGLNPCLEIKADIK